MTAVTHDMTPELAAAQLLREAVRAGETPNIDAIARTTTLTPAAVNAIRDRILSGKRPPKTGLLPPPPQSEAAASPGAHAQRPRWEQAITHPDPDVARAARHIATLVTHLENYLAEHDEALRLRARLLKQLGELRDIPALAPDRPASKPLRKAGEAMPPAG